MNNKTLHRIYSIKEFKPQPDNVLLRLLGFKKTKMFTIIRWGYDPMSLIMWAKNSNYKGQMTKEYVTVEGMPQNKLVRYGNR